MRDGKPFIFTNCMTGKNIEELTDMIIRDALFDFLLAENGLGGCPRESPPAAAPASSSPRRPFRDRLKLLNHALYQDEPAQMPSGTVGKDGYLRLEFADRGDRSVMALADRRVPPRPARAVMGRAMPRCPCISSSPTTGCVLQGDRMALEIEVGKNAQAHVTTQSATKVHMMNANYASQLQDIVVEEGGYLEYMPDPLIPHRTSRFLSKTRLSVAETGSLLYAEVVLPGRKYHHEDEMFGFDLYSSTIEATRRESGEKLFVEKCIIDPRETDLSRTGIMNGYEVFGNVILMTTKEKTMQVREAVEAGVDREARLAYGASLLPGECGLIFKVLGMTSESVRGKIREFWPIARKAVAGRDLPRKPSCGSDADR